MNLFTNTAARGAQCSAVAGSGDTPAVCTPAHSKCYLPHKGPRAFVSDQTNRYARKWNTHKLRARRPRPRQRPRAPAAAGAGRRAAAC